MASTIWMTTAVAAEHGAIEGGRDDGGVGPSWRLLAVLVVVRL
jgi:hypothetical protein